ncbi:MAG: Tad domain-containing protein [Lapillicoccus sp.]
MSIESLRPRVPLRRLALLGRGRRDHGAMSVFVIGLSLVLFGVAGLAIDGGRVINARDRAYDVAEQAARAGANQIDVPELRRSGRVVLLQGDAAGAASNYVRQNSGFTLDGGITTTATTVTVPLKAKLQTTLLSLLNINDLDIEATATASAVTGINGVP